MKSWSDVGIDLPAGAHGQVATTCPQCAHTRKKAGARSLSVNVEEGVFKCHHCDWRGSLKEREPAYRATKIYKRPEPKDLGTLPEKAAKYLASRGITRAVWERNKVGYGPIFMPQVGKEVTALCFPYFRTGELINRKWRDGQKNFRMEKDAERILYKLDDLAEVAVIVEGELDALSCEVVGFRATVSVPDGAPAANTKDYSSKFSFLEADEKRLEGVKTWILAVDADEPGQRLEEELARRLGPEKCRRVAWPEGIKDANECLTELGAGELARLLDEAKPLPLSGVFGVDDLREGVMRLYTHGRSKGVETGWPSLNPLYTVKLGELNIITGTPGSGKSMWMDCLTLNLVELYGWPAAICSPESAPLEEYLATLVEKWTRLPFWEGWNSRLAPDSVEEGMDRLRSMLHLLHDDDANMTLDWLLEKARALVFRAGIRILVIDPWNELEHTRPREIREDEYIGQSLMRLRKFARVNGVAVFVVAHPNKMEADAKGRYKVPSLYDIAGAAHWYNKADNGITVHRLMNADRTVKTEADLEFRTDIHVKKIKRKGVGRPGVAHLEYHPDTSTYSDVKPHQTGMLQGQENT